MNMSVERQRIANLPDYDTFFKKFFLPPKYKVTTILQEIILIVQCKIISYSMP